MASDDWIEGGATDQLLIALQLSESTIKSASSDPLWWRWTIIAAHNALSCACVVRLTETDGTGALKENSTKNLRRYYLDEAPFPDVRLASLTDLLKRLPRPVGPLHINRNPASAKERALKALIEWRDELVHHDDTTLIFTENEARHWCRAALEVILEIVDLPPKKCPSPQEEIVRIAATNCLTQIQAPGA